MNRVSAQAIAKIYRDVLVESLAAARVTSSVGDRDAQTAIEGDFNAAIPSTVPAQFSGQIESQALRDALRLDAALSLIRICEGLPLPRGEFVAAVAQAAQRKV